MTALGSGAPLSNVRAFNDFVPQTDQPQVFVANIEVLADDCGELDARDVFILVPPVELPPPTLDEEEPEAMAPPVRRPSLKGRLRIEPVLGEVA